MFQARCGLHASHQKCSLNFARIKISEKRCHYFSLFQKKRCHYFKLFQKKVSLFFIIKGVSDNQNVQKKKNFFFLLAVSNCSLVFFNFSLKNSASASGFYNSTSFALQVCLYSGGKSYSFRSQAYSLYSQVYSHRSPPHMKLNSAIQP